MDHTIMMLCAMRLDETVSVADFVRAVEDTRRNAKQEAYYALREYVKRGGKMPLMDLIERLASGQGWPFELEETP